MLFPQINCVRTLINLDGLWKFATDKTGSGELNGWESGIAQEYDIAVPASWNEQNRDLMYFFGTGWYEKDIEIPFDFKNKTIWLRIGAANYYSRVWVNGQFVGEHEGGYLPFEFDISSNIREGRANRIIISVNSDMKPDRLPPGDVENEQIVGFKGQYPNNNYDFFPYSGINRPVYIYTTSPTFINDISVETDIEGDIGIISYDIKLNRKLDGKVFIEIDGIPDSKTGTDGNAQGIKGVIRITNAHFWSISNPFLYKIIVILEEKSIMIDKYSMNVGIRTVRISGTSLLLNGKSIFLNGFGMHEDFFVLGKGMNQAVIVKDFSLIKWIGANSIRTSHYPYSEEFLQYADQTGLLVIGETPLVGFVRSHYTSKPILEKAKNVITEMITRDKNHPCIIIWCLANEGDTFVDEADCFYKNLYDHAKALDKTRPLTITNGVDSIDISKDVASRHFDIISINRYHGWYEQSGRLDLGYEFLDKCLDRCYEVFGKPVFVTEFGADAVAGMHIDPPELFSEEYQAEMVTKQFELIKSKHYTIGAHIWVFADFKTSQTTGRVILNRKGLFTRDRQPKLSAHKIRDIWKSGK